MARSPGAATLTAKQLVDELTGVLDDGVEAGWVVCAVLGIPAAALATRLRDTVGTEEVATARRLALRRAEGRPLQYVLGQWSFRTLEVAVDGRVLIPRPETEQVVQVALEELARVGRASTATPVAVDLGTGSGVIALSLAAEGPRPLEVWATDLSADALDVTRGNLGRLAGADPVAAANVRLVRGSWFRALPPDLAGRVSVIVSNPPYVSAEEWAQLDPVVRDHEPYDALVPGPRGLEAIEHIVTEAASWLAPGGAIVVELAPHQAEAACRLARAQGLHDVEVRPDLAGRPRALLGRAGS